MTGKRWQVRRTIECMILKSQPNSWRSTCDRTVWSRGGSCCAHHAGLLRRNTYAWNAIRAFTGGCSSVQSLIDHGFSEKAILHYCRTAWLRDSLDDYVREEVAKRWKTKR